MPMNKNEMRKMMEMMQYFKAEKPKRRIVKYPVDKSIDMRVWGLPKNHAKPVKKSRTPSETQRVKKALKKAGYTDVSVRKGHGTQDGWINIVVYGKEYELYEYLNIRSIAIAASDRSHLSLESEIKVSLEMQLDNPTKLKKPIIWQDEVLSNEFAYSRKIIVRYMGIEYTFYHEVRPDGTEKYAGERSDLTDPRCLLDTLRSLSELMEAFPELADFLKKTFGQEDKVQPSKTTSKSRWMHIEI